MRNNSQDLTITRNFIQHYRFLIKEYELVRARKHHKFRFIEDFYKAHRTNRQTFLKYYHRFKQSGSDSDLLPHKRGPRWKTRRTMPFIENQVTALRQLGNNRYEITDILKPKLKQFTPSPSGVYNILVRHNLNQLTKPMQQAKRHIIKQKAGELGHIDCHHLPKGIIPDENQKLFLVCVIDDYSRIAWAEVTSDITALTVMFASLKCLNILASYYQIKFQEIMTDNGPEFGPRHSLRKDGHPFERMLMELEVKHRYTRPFHPQTNGKVERFWRTIEDDLLRETAFDSLADLKEQLLQYLYYYNQERPHQSLNALSPVKFLKQNLSAN